MPNIEENQSSALQFRSSEQGYSKKVKFECIRSGSYQEVWDYQTSLHRELMEIKKGELKPDFSGTVHHLLLCEHAPVYTLGKSGDDSHLLMNESDREAHKVEYFKINRGGDITFHGPGQITGYPILDLECFFTDVHKYVRLLEEVIISVLDGYGIAGKRIEGFTGVWVEDARGQRKICAIGVHLSRWVTLHGFALNVSTDLSYFGGIIPCGIQEGNKTVTSISKEINREVSWEEVAEKLKSEFARIFGFEYI
jgi:lipoyl(octanoyl) transferase